VPVAKTSRIDRLALEPVSFSLVKVFPDGIVLPDIEVGADIGTPESGKSPSFGGENS
jgi:hypothetical protein